MDRVKRVRGRPFEKNNPGRLPGSKNKSTVIAASLAGEQGEALLGKAIEVAHGGNVMMIKFLLERYLPKERVIPIQLPRIDSALDCITAMSAIVAALAAGQITPREAADLTKVVDTFVRSIEVTEQERRAREVTPPDSSTRANAQRRNHEHHSSNGRSRRIRSALPHAGALASLARLPGGPIRAQRRFRN
jgi:hypothetical protein